MEALLPLNNWLIARTLHVQCAALPHRDGPTRADKGLKELLDPRTHTFPAKWSYLTGEVDDFITNDGNKKDE